MVASLEEEPLFHLEYADLGHPDDLSRPDRIDGEVRLFMAARLGRARLIDNVAATPPPPDEL
jgi:pantothenate synthetase